MIIENMIQIPASSQGRREWGDKGVLRPLAERKCGPERIEKKSIYVSNLGSWAVSCQGGRRSGGKVERNRCA